MRTALVAEARQWAPCAMSPEWQLKLVTKLADALEAARATLTQEQIAEVLRKHQHNYCEECRESYGCTCGWSHGEEVGDCRPDGDSALRSISAHQTEVLAALDGAPEPDDELEEMYQAGCGSWDCRAPECGRA